MYVMHITGYISASIVVGRIFWLLFTCWWRLFRHNIWQPCTVQESQETDQRMLVDAAMQTVL